MNIVSYSHYCVAEIVKSLDRLLFRFKILYIKLTYAYAWYRDICKIVAIPCIHTYISIHVNSM